MIAKRVTGSSSKDAPAERIYVSACQPKEFGDNAVRYAASAPLTSPMGKLALTAF